MNEKRLDACDQCRCGHERREHEAGGAAAVDGCAGFELQYRYLATKPPPAEPEKCATCGQRGGACCSFCGRPCSRHDLTSPNCPPPAESGEDRCSGEASDGRPCALPFGHLRACRSPESPPHQAAPGDGPDPCTPPCDAYDWPKPTIDALKKEVATLRGQLEAAMRELGFAHADRHAALAREQRLRDALEAIEPFLPRLDDGPSRFSAHAQAAGKVRAALAPEVKP